MTANPSFSISSGTLVTLTGTPNPGYVLQDVTIVDSGKNPISKTLGANGTYTFTMPSSDVKITPIFVASPSVTPTTVPVPIPQPTKVPTPTPERSPFSDVETTHPLYNDIKWANSQKLMMGYKDGTYKPGKAVSSITVIVVLGRMDNPNLKNATSGLWYSPYVSWANSKGIIPSDVKIQDTILTRGEMARLLVNYLKSKGVDCSVPANAATFTDANQMSRAEREAFQILYSKGIFQGVSNQSIQMNPKGSLNRAPLAALLQRLSGWV